MMISRWRRVRVKYVLLAILGLLVLDYFGTFTHIFEKDFYTEFHYPLDGDVPHYVYQVRHGHVADTPPLNTFNYTFLYNPKQKCKEDGFDLKPQVVFLVKSAMNHFKRRNAIRSSWGHERRFSDVLIRTVFLLGVASSEESASVQNLVDIEAANFEDIVQANFIDTYFNNTMKTMSGFRWAVENCHSAKYYMFVDDDYFVSTKNVLRFLKDPTNYPEYIQEADEIISQLARKLTENKSAVNFTDSMQIREIERVLEKQSPHGHHSVDSRMNMAVIQERYSELKMGKVAKEGEEDELKENEINSINNRKLLSKELPLNVKLFSGFVINSSPHRHKSSKWHITLDEYPYHMWPTYISAGSYVLSREALIQLFYTSWFTKMFR